MDARLNAGEDACATALVAAAQHNAGVHAQTNNKTIDTRVLYMQYVGDCIPILWNVSLF